MSVDLDELERLLKGATPGPWERVHDREYTNVICREGDSIFNAVVGESACGCGVNLDPNISDEDARLIVSLRNAAPELIDEIRTLRESLHAARAKIARDRIQAALDGVLELPPEDEAPPPKDAADDVRCRIILDKKSGTWRCTSAGCGATGVLFDGRLAESAPPFNGVPMKDVPPLAFQQTARPTPGSVCVFDRGWR